jgi:hypothetical protein
VTYPPLIAVIAKFKGLTQQKSFFQLFLLTLPRVLAVSFITFATALIILPPMLWIRKRNFFWLRQNILEKNNAVLWPESGNCKIQFQVRPSGPEQPLLDAQVITERRRPSLDGTNNQNIPGANNASMTKAIPKNGIWLSNKEAVAEVFFFLDSTLLFMLLLCGDRKLEFLPLSWNLMKDLYAGAAISLLLAPLFLFRVSSVSALTIDHRHMALILPHGRFLLETSSIENMKGSSNKGFLFITLKNGKKISIREIITGQKLFRGILTLSRSIITSENGETI